ncbi:unnamed protein product [Auanema sp. JU1783]|nr:unnamed protein product [Auanema sp. JU1783]
MPTRHSLNPNDADDSDSSESSLSPIRVPRRSATVSPSTRNSFKQHQARRRSDFNLNIEKSRERERERRQRSIYASRERSESRKRLRKTNSEPNVEGAPQDQLDIDTLRIILDHLPKLTSSVTQNDSDSGGEDMSTEIEELRDAAKSIQSLQRVLKLPPQHSSDRGVFSDADDASTATDTGTEGRVSGISTKFGHPRGVMQFLPSIRHDSFGSSQSDTYRSRNSISRKTSAPDPSYLAYPESISVEKSPRTRRRGVVDELYSSTNQLLDRKGSESLAGVSRFSKLLKSFRSRPNSPDQHPTITWSPYVYSQSADEECQMDNSLLEADIMLWKKRSRASLRRHYSVRNLAARELFDTEKSFVEGLEFLVTKYMRPLRQPLECTLIEAGLVDKIFYRIPEILAHHQVLLAALSSRIENWHKDSVIGDVLLGHFSKQSMIETYISFVDNFKAAKQAIAQARLKPSFEKYYNRCCRDHRNKLDLDSLLISPIQRIPRYELMVKQLLKHTPAEHSDHERLSRAQRHIHNLAIAINQHKDAHEQQEQRLREIEAIVDGLDDLVSSGRNLIRYDMVTMHGREGKQQRCVFTLSDQLLLTSVKRKNPNRNGKLITQSADFLDSNKFKLLIKISLDDVQIGKDTLAMLQETESAIESVREDEKVIKKIIELANLLKSNKEKLMGILDEVDSDNSKRLRSLTDQMTTNPDLTTVQLSVATINGLEIVPLEFGNAEKRAAWECAFRETKASLINQQLSASPSQLKSVIAHQTRPGLQLCQATVVPGKRVDSTPSVWICASDKFSGQVAVVSLENGEPTIESSAGIGNAAITAACTVPPPMKPKKRKMRTQKSLDLLSRNESLLDLHSSGESSDSSSEDGVVPSGQTTVWIGNEDGEVFVMNSTDRVRTRPRERVARLANPVTAICPCNGFVYIATSTDSDPILMCFKPLSDRSWDLDNPTILQHGLKSSINALEIIGRRLIVASSSSIHIFDTETLKWQSSPGFLPPGDEVTVMSAAGTIIYASGKTSTTVHALDAFTLEILSHFSISAVIRTQLAGREDILREHKMGCLRISCMTVSRWHLWIGTSAGFVVCAPLNSARSQPNPSLTVCDVAHSGPSRVLIPINITISKKQKRMSLNIPAQQASELLILSCGEGLEERDSQQDPATDSVNHLLFWKCH